MNLIRVARRARRRVTIVTAALALAGLAGVSLQVSDAQASDVRAPATARSG